MKTWSGKAKTSTCRLQLELLNSVVQLPGRRWANVVYDDLGVIALAHALFRIDDAQFLGSPFQTGDLVQTSELIMTPDDFVFLLHAPGCTAVRFETPYLLGDVLLRDDVVFSSFSVNR